MVDVSNNVGSAHIPRTSNVSSTIDSVSGKAGTTLADYLSLASKSVTAPAQSPDWVSAWVSASPEIDSLFLYVNEDETQLFLPLEVTRIGPIRIASFIGGKHANGNFPPVAGNGRISDQAIIETIRRERRDIDLINLERLAHRVGGQPNPLLHLATGESPNVSLAVDLQGGFDALLSRTSGKRKRKKHRSQSRKFEAVGSYRRFEASTPTEVKRVLDAFFVLKSIRFKQLGLRDVFADESVRSAFHNLFDNALSVTPRPFVLHALEVAGKIRAITGSSRSGDRLICEFGAIADDDLSHASPGEFLFFENIRDACNDGFAIYDFSVGDEHYKRLWCNIEEKQFDVLLPTSVKGRLLGGFLRLASWGKRIIKSNERIWSAYKRLRRSRAAEPHGASDDD